MSNCTVCHKPVKSGIVVHSECMELLQKTQQLDNKPLTNGDRIQAMSDEELAELLVFGIKVNDENMYFDVKLKTICNSRLLAQDCCLDWLKQPVEVE